MTPETTVFVLTIGLAFVHILIVAHFQTARYGLAALASPRDKLIQPDDEGLYLARARRANDNMRETLPWALGLLILVQITGSAGAVAAAGAWIYFWARLAYLPLYLFGVAWLRTLAWFISLGGLATLVYAVIA